jgi:hypothetical protein
LLTILLKWPFNSGHFFSFFENTSFFLKFHPLNNNGADFSDSPVVFTSGDFPVQKIIAKNYAPFPGTFVVIPKKLKKEPGNEYRALIF